MTGASIQDRYGTEAEDKNDNKIINTIWKYSPTSYDNEKIVELPYFHCSYATIAGATGCVAWQQYKINSIYDPDLTGGGNQPLGRDTWASIYNYYKVLETHVKVTVSELSYATTPNAFNSMPTHHGWMADITASPPGNLAQWGFNSISNNNNKQQKFSPILTYDVMAGRGQKPITYEYHWDASQFDTSIIDNAKNEWCAVSGDPANINYFSCLAGAQNSAGDSRTIYFKAEIRYLVAFKQINRTLMNTLN